MGETKKSRLAELEAERKEMDEEIGRLILEKRALVDRMEALQIKRHESNQESIRILEAREKGGAA